VLRKADVHLTCCSYLRLKFSSPSEAARAVDTLKEYKREGLELTFKFFAEDDSEGSGLLMLRELTLLFSVCHLRAVVAGTIAKVAGAITNSSTTLVVW